MWRSKRFRYTQGNSLAGRLPYLLGTMLAGWGLFNLVEGLVDHFILGIHHVRDDLGPGTAQLAWDIGFLVWGAAMLLIGWLWARSARREA